MKKIYLILFIISIANLTKATVLTVNNAGGAQYANLQSAYNAANTNDTLLVSGSSIAYNLTSSFWSKKLVVIGNGFNTDKQVFQQTKFSTTYSNVFIITSDSVRFIGIRFLNQINQNSDIKGLYFESCQFDATYYCNGYENKNTIFINSVFTSGAENYSSSNSSSIDVLFQNCIFSGKFRGSTNNYNFSVSTDHCVFLKDGAAFDAVYNMNISNCIFLGNNPISSIFNSAFTNNISRADIANAWAINGNVSINNLDSINPLFVNVPINTAYNNTMDFNLQNGSPAIGQATDGSNIGVHGGIGNNFNEEGEGQNIPIIRRMNIINTNVPQNGNVNVKVRSTKAREN